MSRPITAILFDMDGVLLDSEPLYRKMIMDGLAQLGHSVSDEEFDQFVGIHAHKMWEVLKTKFDLSETVEELISKEKKAKYNLLKSSDLKPIQGIISLITSLKSRQYKLAVVSSSLRVNVELVLKKLKIFSFFDVIVTGEDVNNGKPAPDIYLLAATRIKSHPSECIVIEDAKNGVLAGNAAGIKTIGYKNPNSGNQDLSAANVTVQAISEIEENLF